MIMIMIMIMIILWIWLGQKLHNVPVTDSPPAKRIERVERLWKENLLSCLSWTIFIFRVVQFFNPFGWWAVRYRHIFPKFEIFAQYYDLYNISRRWQEVAHPSVVVSEGLSYLRQAMIMSIVDILTLALQHDQARCRPTMCSSLRGFLLNNLHAQLSGGL